MKWILFYDGNCALCHGFVKFVLARDLAHDYFRYAPLGGETFQRLAVNTSLSDKMDSIVLLDAEGNWYVQSAAVVRILGRLGTGWRALSTLLWLVPKPVRDFGYKLVARMRYRIFGTTTEQCPLITQDLRNRFIP